VSDSNHLPRGLTAAGLVVTAMATANKPFDLTSAEPSGYYIRSAEERLIGGGGDGGIDRIGSAIRIGLGSRGNRYLAIGRFIAEQRSSLT